MFLFESVVILFLFNMGDDSDDDYDFEEFKEKWNKNRKSEFNFDEWCKVRLL